MICALYLFFMPRKAEMIMQGSTFWFRIEQLNTEENRIISFIQNQFLETFDSLCEEKQLEISEFMEESDSELVFKSLKDKWFRDTSAYILEL